MEARWIMYKIKPRISQRAFTKLITKDIDKIYHQYVIQAQSIIQISLYLEILDLIHNTSVWKDFNSHGYLWKRLGAGNLAQLLEDIIQHWATTVDISHVSQIIAGNKYDVLKFKAIKADYSDVLSNASAVFESISQRPGPYKGNVTEIKWLKWLLLSGRNYVVKHYVFTDKFDGSRGGGLMIAKRGGGWRVPQEYAGTIDDNFLTRALDSSLDKIIADINAKIGQL